MIYVTGDMHGDFRRLTGQSGFCKSHTLSAEDYILVCGDLGLLWSYDRSFGFWLEILEELPCPLLWVQGNHENYNMIADFCISLWNGGKVRHILKNKIILLERGQVFQLDGKSFFTFGGASSHDTQGGILDRDSPYFKRRRRRAEQEGLPYRIRNESWWKEELPSEEEMQEGLKNLEAVGYDVDYVITHCLSSQMQKELEHVAGLQYQPDILTEYFNQIDERLEYRKWYCGHYHVDLELDTKHTILYNEILEI